MFTVTLPELGGACFLSSFTDSFRIPFFLQRFLLVRLSGRFCSVQMLHCSYSDFLCRNGTRNQTQQSGSMRRKAEGRVSGFCSVSLLKGTLRWQVTLESS